MPLRTRDKKCRDRVGVTTCCGTSEASAQLFLNIGGPGMGNPSAQGSAGIGTANLGIGGLGSGLEVQGLNEPVIGSNRGISVPLLNQQAGKPLGVNGNPAGTGGGPLSSAGTPVVGCQFRHQYAHRAGQRPRVSSSEFGGKSGWQTEADQQCRGRLVEQPSRGHARQIRQKSLIRLIRLPRVLVASG